MQRRTDRVRAHGLEWLTVEQFAATIRALDIERSRHPDALGSEELVKDNTVRTVMRMADPLAPEGPGLYLKRYKFRDLGDRLKHLVLPAKPVREWRVCRALQAAGIPTCDVLAIALRRKRGLLREGFLLSTEVAGALSLPRFWREELAGGGASAEQRAREVVAEMAALTAALVEGGFYHHDYHAGNLLIRPEAPAGSRLHVVDLHSVRLRRPGRRGLLRMLGMLSGFVHLEESPPLREAFTRQFLACWHGGLGAGEAAVAHWSQRIARSRAALRRRHLRSRTRRCLVHSTLFTIEEAEGYVVHRRRDFALAAALEAVACHRSAVDGGADGAQVLHKGRRTEVSICPCEAVPPFDVSRPAPSRKRGPGRVCVKCFRRDDFIARIKDALRLRRRARWSWTAARGFSVRGIPAARPLALLEQRSTAGGGPDYLIVEALENDGSLGALAAEGLPRGTPRRRLGRRVAQLLDRLATEEVYHPDTKPTNFLARRTDGDFKLWLVDMDRARFDTRFGRGLWIKCLARLNAGLPADITLLDRMRCLRECGRGRWEGRERLEIARRVYCTSLAYRPAWLGTRPPP
ncbi:MAG: lipopolysaccharide kinase InaA family protein [Planctomycetota bacterium]